MSHTLLKGITTPADTACMIHRSATSSGVIHSWHFLAFGDVVYLIGEDCVGYRVDSMTRDAARAEYSRLKGLGFAPHPWRKPYAAIGLDSVGRYDFERAA